MDITLLYACQGHRSLIFLGEMVLYSVSCKHLNFSLTSLLSYIVTKFLFQCLLKLMFLTVLHCLVICGAWVPLQNIASFFFFLLFHYERWLFFISRFHDILYNFVFLVNNTVRFWFHESFFLSFYSNKCNPATKRIRIELLLAPGNTYASNYIGKQLLENKIE